MDPFHEEILRRLAIGDEMIVGLAGLGALANSLPPRIASLMRLAATLGIGPEPISVLHGVSECQRHGSSDAQILSLTDAIAPVLGSVRANQAIGTVRAALDVV